jgi:hypothetical protein
MRAGRVFITDRGPHTAKGRAHTRGRGRAHLKACCTELEGGAHK